MRMIDSLILAAAIIALRLPSAVAQTRFSTMYNFTGTYPVGLTASKGVLYGATALDALTGYSCGAIFALLPPAAGGSAWSEAVLYSFANSNDACFPITAPMLGPGGGLYGVTTYGGASGDGALYEVQPPAAPGGPWTESVLYSFALGNGFAYPAGSLIAGPNGSFYALTGGGANANGALAQLSPPAAPGAAWTATLLYSFPDGTLPYSLTLGRNGVFYGTEQAAVFQLTPPAASGGTWTYTVLYSLPAYTGFNPTSLIVASNGTIYGSSGASYPTNGEGLVFRLTPPAAAGGAWTFTTLHNFGTGWVTWPLTHRNGNLYGAIASSQSGAVFELQPPTTSGGAWTLTYLHQFTGGEVPYGSLIVANGGRLYGVSQAGIGDPPSGTAYAIALK